jgi:hypothetical protein
MLIKKNLLALALLTAAALAPLTAAASDKDNNYSIRGARSCAQFLKAPQNPYQAEYLVISAWLAGYMTAYNKLTPDTFDILGNSDFDGALLFIKGYCERQPLDNMGTAAEALMTALKPERKTHQTN